MTLQAACAVLLLRSWIMLIEKDWAGRAFSQWGYQAWVVRQFLLESGFRFSVKFFRLPWCPFNWYDRYQCMRKDQSVSGVNRLQKWQWRCRVRGYKLQILDLNIRALGLVGYHHTISSHELQTNNSPGGMICKLLRSNPVLHRAFH